MLPKIHRLPLRQTAGFPRQFQTLRVLGTVVYFRPLSQDLDLDNSSRVAIVVPKTTAKLATQRNRAKRQLGALLSPILSNHPGLEIVFYLRSLPLALDKSKLEAILLDLSQLIRRSPTP